MHANAVQPEAHVCIRFAEKYARFARPGCHNWSRTSTAAAASPHTGRTKCGAGGPVVAPVDGGSIYGNREWSWIIRGRHNWSPRTNHVQDQLLPDRPRPL